MSKCCGELRLTIGRVLGTEAMQAACDSQHIKNNTVLESPSCHVDYSPAVGTHSRYGCTHARTHIHTRYVNHHHPTQCYIFVETRGEEALDILWGQCALGLADMRPSSHPMRCNVQSSGMLSTRTGLWSTRRAPR